MDARPFGASGCQMSKVGKVASLSDALHKFEEIPFPPDSNDDRLSELHARLAEYDGYVAGLIETILRGGGLPSNVAEFDENLRSRLEQIAAHGSDSSAGEAQTYLAYLQGLFDLLEMARAIATD